MGKGWDIIPPRPRIIHRTVKRHKKTSQKATLFFGILVIIFLGIFFSSTLKNSPADISGITTQNPGASKAPSVTNVSPTPKTREDLLIKILNGSGLNEETEAVQTLLEGDGFPVAKKENALNIYNQTIIYYEKNQEKYALQIAEILKKYAPKTQKFSQESPYDLTIIIGAR